MTKNFNLRIPRTRRAQVSTTPAASWMMRARHPTVAALLGLLAGDGDVPRGGQRDIIASAIRRALDTSSTSEFPNLARLIGEEGLGELDQRPPDAAAATCMCAASIKVSRFSR